MSGFFDSQDFQFRCPHCKRSIQTTVADIKRSDYKCSRCGTKFETSDFKRGIENGERQIDEFKRRLGNIKIDIKI